MSLVSGRIRCQQNRDEWKDETKSELVEPGRQTVGIPSASDFLGQERGWRGLEPQVGETPVPSLAKEGRRGIPSSGYSSEIQTVANNEEPSE